MWLWLPVRMLLETRIMPFWSNATQRRAPLELRLTLIGFVLALLLTGPLSLLATPAAAEGERSLASQSYAPGGVAVILGPWIETIQQVADETNVPWQVI